MFRLSLFTFVLLVGLSLALVKNDVKFRNIYQKHISRNNEQIRTLRHLMGDLIDTETNAIYMVDGLKQQDTPLNIDTTTVAPNLPINYGEIACLAACHSCVEHYSIGSRKKRATDNCGPMCDCADSCFYMPSEQVGNIYGQRSNTGNDKDCWWRTYNEMLNTA